MANRFTDGVATHFVPIDQLCVGGKSVIEFAGIQPSTKLGFELRPEGHGTFPVQMYCHDVYPTKCLICIDSRNVSVRSVSAAHLPSTQHGEYHTFSQMSAKTRDTARGNSDLPGVMTDEVTRTVYATDNSIYQLAPAGVAFPGAATEISTLLRANHASAEPVPIVARGAGTGTNGQSLTRGVVIELKRNLDRIVEIDPVARTARVEPGVVTAELNAQLKQHGLFWAPHTSTLNRATVGGMIATDAAGKGSIIHGRAHRHVLGLDVLLADGTPFRAEPTAQAVAEERANTPGETGRLWRSLLELGIDEDDHFDLPELARGFSGYGIDRFRHDGLVDPLALLVGSEGTLAITTEATLRLSPIPEHTTLVVAAYTSFAEALEDSVELRATGPSAIESFDERTLDVGRASPAWPALGMVVGDLSGSVLLLEYQSDSPIDDAPIHEAIAATGRSVRAATLTSAADQERAWTVRADAVGLVAKIEVGGPERSARPTAFVEDCAVPVASMCAFIADFRSVLDDFGVEYAMYGHADVGCVHVRPALDLTDPAHEGLVRAITDRVVEVVKAHHGVLWGEHGRGFRGDVVSDFLTSRTIEIMRDVKAAFDPRDLLNPGKLYRPTGASTPIDALDEVPTRGQINRSVPVEIRREFSHAFSCNGNGLCHHYDTAEVMCPSYKATGDAALSPKGRADLLRSFLARRQDGGDPAFEDRVAENLHQCLSCSACTGRCPVEVDIPELKSKFLEVYYETRRRPIAHRVLSHFETFAALGTRIPRLAGHGAGPVGTLLGLVDLPAPQKARDKSTVPTFDRSAARPTWDVVLLRDVFTSQIEPETIEKAAAVLQSFGLRVALSPFVPSGKFDHVKGNRRRFAKAAATQAALVEDIVDAGAVPVAIEPATALLHDHEYPRFIAPYPAEAVRHLVDILHEHRHLLRPAVGSVTLLGHCTERSLRPDSLVRWTEVLEATGLTVSNPDLGCCGMAGIFGHEVANQEMSKTLWVQTWEPAIQASTTSVATGYSCRSQTKRLSDVEIRHPIHLL